MLPQAGGEGHGKLLIKKYRISVWEDEEVLEMAGGDGCTAQRICLMALNYTLRMVNFVLCIFTTTHTHAHARAYNNTTFAEVRCSAYIEDSLT